jgi:hypothetical protein
MRLGVAAIAVAGEAMLWAAAASAQALDWRVFEEGEHGCRLDYPGAIFSSDDPEPGAPRRFSGSAENVYFRVLGTENTANWSPAEIRQRYLGASMPGRVVYERTKERFLVLSGYRNGNIFYTKVVVSNDRRVACILDITYPRAMKEQFDRIVTRMSRSFSVAN